MCFAASENTLVASPRNVQTIALNHACHEDIQNITRTNTYLNITFTCKVDSAYSRSSRYFI